MHCPRCGQKQVSDVVRFCSRCGFPLDGVIQLLASGGMLPVYQPAEGAREMSPRKKGVRQGGILVLTGALLVPILGVLDSFARNSQFLDILVALAAIICFLGGPLRMLYAAVFEEPAPSRFPPTSYRPAPMPAHYDSPAAALPPPSASPAKGWVQRPNTADLAHRPSVTTHHTLTRQGRFERSLRKRALIFTVVGGY